MPPYAGPPAARPGDVAGVLRLLAYLILATALMVLDYRSGWLRAVRAQAEVVEMEISGRNLAEGVPKMIKINSNEVLEALHEPLSGIVSAVKLALEQTPPELCADVAERGIVLTGGGALLRDIDRLISEETGLHVQVADDPLTCVARGGGRALELVDMHGNEFFAPE